MTYHSEEIITSTLFSDVRLNGGGTTFGRVEISMDGGVTYRALCTEGLEKDNNVATVSSISHSTCEGCGNKHHVMFIT